MAKSTVLIVEDEAIVAADLAGKLAMLGYEVAGSTSTGEEAIELAYRLLPHLILMDIQLKGAMDGIEAAEKIHRLFDIPVIYLTAYSDLSTLERAKQSGHYGYILKPFDERELVTAIELTLSKHQADRQLREQRELLRVTLTSIGDAVIACDIDGKVTFMNPVAEQLTGWTAEAARNQPLPGLLHLFNEKTRRPFNDIPVNMLKDGKTREPADTTVLVTNDGREVPIEYSAAPIRDANNRAVGAVFVFRDVTEKQLNQEALQLANKELATANEELRAQGEELVASCQVLERAEAALRKSHAKLENRVAERTQELTLTIEKLEMEIKARQEAEKELKIEVEARLRTAEELRAKEQILMMQSRQAAMGEMIGNIAHQWRQPLNTLGLMIQTLPIMQEMGELDGQVIENTAQKAMKLIRHMSRTVDDFRNYFRPEKEKVSFFASETVSRTAELVAESFKDSGITIEIHTEDDSIINGYPNEFSQALLNILMNARDAHLEREMCEPKVIIRIGKSSEKTLVSISDNAGGIPEEIIGKIFDPYFTTKDPDRGTGVGLFMSKGIIEKNMGGRITVRNTGDGAEFRIEV